MNSKLIFSAIGLIIGIAIIAIFLINPGATLTPPTPSELKISNFQFSEVAEGPAKLMITTLPGSITFEGPITKPTPCDTISAVYKTNGGNAVIDITSKGSSGICIQVIKDTFYKGSFEYSGALAGITINYKGQELVSAKL